MPTQQFFSYIIAFLMIIFVYCSELSYLEVIDTEQASPKRRKIDVTYLP
jgi:hypothetical protein